MTDDFTIRRATHEDSDSLARLRRDMQTELMPTDTRSDLLSPDSLMGLNLDYFREKLPTGDFVAFLAEMDEVIVGTSGMVIYRAPPTGGNPTGVEGYVMNMYTVPEYRGHRIATRLLDHLTEHIRGLGGHRAWLRASESGRPVYSRYGFLGDDPNYMVYRIPQQEGE